MHGLRTFLTHDLKKRLRLNIQLNQLKHFSNEDNNEYLSKFMLKLERKTDCHPRESLIISIAAGLQRITKRLEVNLFKYVETKRLTDALDASIKHQLHHFLPGTVRYHKPISISDVEETLHSNVLGVD